MLWRLPVRLDNTIALDYKVPFNSDIYQSYTRLNDQYISQAVWLDQFPNHMNLMKFYNLKLHYGEHLRAFTDHDIEQLVYRTFADKKKIQTSNQHWK